MRMMDHVRNGCFISTWERRDLLLGLYQLWKSRMENQRSLERQDVSAYDGRTASTFRRSVHVARQQTGDAARMVAEMFDMLSDRDRTDRNLLRMVNETLPADKQKEMTTEEPPSQVEELRTA
jgi:hypothetical protein